eukprot:5422528-Pyramimonas_sp.AAC.1
MGLVEGACTPQPSGLFLFLVGLRRGRRQGGQACQAVAAAQRGLPAAAHRGGGAQGRARGQVRGQPRVQEAAGQQRGQQRRPGAVPAGRVLQ